MKNVLNRVKIWGTYDNLNKRQPTFSIAFLDILRFCEGWPSWRNSLPFLFCLFVTFQKDIKKMFFNRLCNFSPLILPSYWVTFNYIFTTRNHHHKLCYTSPRTFFFFPNTTVWGLDSSFSMFLYKIFLPGMQDCLCGPKKNHQGWIIYLLSGNLRASYCTD